MKKFFFIIFFLPLMATAEDHGTHPNHHASLFVGAASGIYDDGSTHPAFGLEYEYLFTDTKPVLGIGLLAEFVVGDHTETILGAPVFVHPWRGLKFFAMPAVMITSHDNSHAAEPHEELTLEENKKSSDFQFLIRPGAGYDFHFGSFAITPLIAADVIESKFIIVFGIDFGIIF
jgi:hypothetical protein